MPLIYETIQVNTHTYAYKLHIHSGSIVSALIMATNFGFNRAAEVLIQKGADINVVGEYGYTALMNAADRGYVNIFKLLVDRGADINRVDRDDNSTLHLVAQRGITYQTRVV